MADLTQAGDQMEKDLPEDEKLALQHFLDAGEQGVPLQKLAVSGIQTSTFQQLLRKNLVEAAGTKGFVHHKFHTPDKQ